VLPQALGRHDEGLAAIARRFPISHGMAQGPLGAGTVGRSGLTPLESWLALARGSVTRYEPAG
jgi:hypothetical protein